MEKCKQTRKHKYTFTILISSWQCNYSKKRLLSYRWASFAKTTDILVSGSAVKNHGWPKRRSQLYAQRTISYRLLFAVCPILEANRIQHRHHRTRLQQVQPKSLWRFSSRTLAQTTPKNPKPKSKEWWQSRFGSNVCEIFLNGWRSSQIIWRTLKCLHPHTFLRTQIRNVLRKWYQNPGGIVFYTHFPKGAMSACEPKWQALLAEDALAMLYLEQKKFGDLTSADHKVLNEEGERNNHRYAVVVQDLATQWIQSYPCKTKTSQDTEKSLRQFLEPSHRPV